MKFPGNIDNGTRNRQQDFCGYDPDHPLIQENFVNDLVPLHS